MRDLRNNTAEVMRSISNGASVEITSHDKPVALLKPLIVDRLKAAKQLRSSPPVDTGWIEELAEDDALSCEDL